MQSENFKGLALRKIILSYYLINVLHRPWKGCTTAFSYYQNKSVNKGIVTECIFLDISDFLTQLKSPFFFFRHRGDLLSHRYCVTVWIGCSPMLASQANAPCCWTVIVIGITVHTDMPHAHISIKGVSFYVTLCLNQICVWGLFSVTARLSHVCNKWRLPKNISFVFVTLWIWS